MTDFLFDLPAWFPIVGLAVGVALFVYGNNRTDATLSRVGLGVVAAAILLTAVSYFVDTPAEKCVDRTRGIVAAVDAGDWAKLKSLLDENTRAGTRTPVRGKAALAELVETQAGVIGLRDASITSLSVEAGPMAGANINVVVATLATTNFGPVTSTWTFAYERRSDGILLSLIKPERIGQTDVNEIEGRIRPR